METEEIKQFLSKLNLEEYYDEFTGDQSLHAIKKVQDFEFYLKNETALEAAGLTDEEIGRFIRMCQETIQVSNNIILYYLNFIKNIFSVYNELPVY